MKLKLSNYALEVMRLMKREGSVAHWRVHSTCRSMLFDRDLVESFQKDGLFPHMKLTSAGAAALKESNNA